jgi:hypothetical protein
MTTIDGFVPTIIFAMRESAQALSTPKEVLDNASAITNVRIKVQETTRTSNINSHSPEGSPLDKAADGIYYRSVS